MYYKTKEIAKILGVSEGTIKNWSRKNLIQSHRTIGGHRRFSLLDVIKFIKENNIKDIAGFYKIKLDILNYILKEDYQNLSDILLTYILREEANEVEDFLKILLFSIGIYKTFDIIVSRSLNKLGKFSEARKIGIDEEHIASSKLIEAIINLKNIFKSKKNINTKVILSSLEGDIHEIPLRILDFILNYEGFKVIYVGINTPYEEILKTIKREKPKFLVISSVFVLDRRKFEKSIKFLEESCEEISCILLIGGPIYGEKPKIEKKIYTTYEQLINDIKRRKK
ncbi:MAG: helix-turn-helix domain-containing protein [candidate division WOR-3 bacterium]|nr:helix-turn-helix domain-containing protein [candidate division WOR-3 bacterium]MDW8150223.1 helix-turn-helix domain-containing protein [candidate division WOR-3 bacterium]